MLYLCYVNLDNYLILTAGLSVTSVRGKNRWTETGSVD